MSNLDKNIYCAASHLEKKIIVYKEAKKTSLTQISNYFNYLNEIIGNKSFHYIIDLSNTNPPSAEVRNYIKKELQKIDHLIESYSVIIGQNFLLKIALKFVGASLGLSNFKTYKSIAAAIKYLENEYKH